MRRVIHHTSTFAKQNAGNILRPQNTGRGRCSLATMATPYKIEISPDNTGLLKGRQTEEVARKASELLQRDMEDHHVFFNEDSYHNHVSVLSRLPSNARTQVA